MEERKIRAAVDAALKTARVWGQEAVETYRRAKDFPLALTGMVMIEVLVEQPLILMPKLTNQKR